jgi:hypothetical protein
VGAAGCFLTGPPDRLGELGEHEAMLGADLLARGLGLLDVAKLNTC